MEAVRYSGDCLPRHKFEQLFTHQVTFTRAKEARCRDHVPGSSIMRKDALKKARRKELSVSFLPQLEGVQHGERCLPHLPYRKERALNLDLRLETQYQTHYNKTSAERGPMCLPPAY